MGAYLPKLGWPKVNLPLMSEKKERVPIKGYLPRLKNIAVNNFRGLLGFLFPVAILSWQIGKGKKLVKCLWMFMGWYFFTQPIATPATAGFPVWILPMGGAVSTVDTAKCYFNEGIALFILSSMFLLMLNNAGTDRRIALYLICCGDSSKFTAKRMVFKCSVAAFILSMFSNRLIVTTIIMEYVTPIFVNLQSTAGLSPTEPDYNKVRYILNNAIQTSSAIGSMAMMFSSFCSLAFRAIWADSCMYGGLEYPDIFNFLQYAQFAFPLALTLFIVNLIYHLLLMHYVVKKQMSIMSKMEVRNQMLKHKSTIPKKFTTHEKLSVFFMIVAIVLLFSRKNAYTDGWAAYNHDNGKAVIRDCTVLAIFLLAMSSLPRGISFLTLFSLKKKSQVKDLKPESSILFWRFVDTNTVYSYFFLIGSGVALNLATLRSGLYEDITKYSGKHITDLGWKLGVFVVCLISTILANVMTGVAGLVIFLPFVLNMTRSGAAIPWEHHSYIPALGVGLTSSLGFMMPFLYTPAYICHNIGKVPISKMAKYSFISVLLCLIITWNQLIFWAPYIFNRTGLGVTCGAMAVTGNVKGGAAVAPPPSEAEPPKDEP